MKLFGSLQRTDDVPEGLDWLGPDEKRALTELRFPKRRHDWLLGRWTAKRALCRLHGQPERSAGDWQILADGDGAPAVWHGGRKSSQSLSLSHSGDTAWCLLAEGRIRLGCDIEQVEDRSPVFEETFFNATELEWLDRLPADRRSEGATLIWSAKESVLKLLRVGLRADTRRVEIREPGGDSGSGWSSFAAADLEDGRDYSGWWQVRDGRILTAVASPVTAQPLRL